MAGRLTDLTPSAHLVLLGMAANAHDTGTATIPQACYFRAGSTWPPHGFGAPSTTALPSGSWPAPWPSSPTLGWWSWWAAASPHAAPPSTGSTSERGVHGCVDRPYGIHSTGWG